MKPIRSLTEPPPGLADYLATKLDGPNWTEFRSHGSGGSYLELIAELTANQHGLCAYCEIQLRENDRQVEHFVPQTENTSQALDVANLMAACTGGSSRRFGPDRRLHDPDRHLAPLRDNLSCGQAKGNKSVTDAIDPRTLPEEPVFVVRSDGRLEVADEACGTAGVRVDRATHTLEALGLNVERLWMARRRHWNDLAEESGAIGDEAR